MIPKDHPRYESLVAREKIVEGLERGITGMQGLIAQGRGEAFDYLIGEKTLRSALHAEKVAAALLLLAEKPVISVNGNVAALVPVEIVKLSEVVTASLEVNLFYRTEERMKKIHQYLRAHGAQRMYTKSDALIPGIDHERAKVDADGIYSADVVLVPLEDGDRAKALVDMGKTIIAIDLNPLSRTAQVAQVTIVDNITRAVPNLITFSQELEDFRDEELLKIVEDFDNEKNRAFATREIIDYLKLHSRLF